MPQNELTVLYNIKTPEGRFVQKYGETLRTTSKKKINKKKCYIHIQSKTRRKQRSTGKDTTSKLKHSKPVTMKKEISKAVFFHCLQTYKPYS